MRQGGDLWNNNKSDAREVLEVPAVPWFQSPLLPAHVLSNEGGSIPERTLLDSLTWPSFIEGWLAAAAALRTHTPRGFRVDVRRTGLWAVQKTKFLVGSEMAEIQRVSTARAKIATATAAAADAVIVAQTQVRF